MIEKAFIGVGGNVGAPEDVARIIIRAGELLRAAAGIESLEASPLYVTEPWGVADQSPFVNGVFAVATSLDPSALLGLLKRLEGELGREETYRWGPRVIDMDILLFGECRHESETLLIPHPYLLHRPFAHIPLLDLAPDARLPSGALLRDVVEAVRPPRGMRRMPIRTP